MTAPAPEVKHGGCWRCAEKRHQILTSVTHPTMHLTSVALCPPCLVVHKAEHPGTVRD